MNKFVAIFAASLAASPAFAGEFLDKVNGKGTVVINNDGGGIVTDYEKAVYRYNYEHRRVEIRGSCRSACTLALGVKNVCVGKGAYLKWHHAYITQTDELVPSTTSEMLQNIPASVARTVGPYIQRDYNPRASLDYASLVSLGIPDCDSTKPPVVVVEKPVTVDTYGLARENTYVNFTKAARSKKKRRVAQTTNNPLQAILNAIGF